MSQRKLKGAANDRLFSRYVRFGWNLHDERVLRGQRTATMVGGLSESDIAGDEVKAAADAAVRILSVKGEGPLQLKKIISAKTQVVAGMNYFLTLQIEGRKKEPELVEVVIWRKLDGTYEMTKTVWQKQ